jgi:hypothetical protein
MPVSNLIKVKLHVGFDPPPRRHGNGLDEALRKADVSSLDLTYLKFKRQVNRRAKTAPSF